MRPIWLDGQFDGELRCQMPTGRVLEFLRPLQSTPLVQFTGQGKERCGTGDIGREHRLVIRGHRREVDQRLLTIRREKTVEVQGTAAVLDSNVLEHQLDEHLPQQCGARHAQDVFTATDDNWQQTQHPKEFPTKGFDALGVGMKGRPG